SSQVSSALQPVCRMSRSSSSLIPKFAEQCRRSLCLFFSFWWSPRVSYILPSWFPLVWLSHVELGLGFLWSKRGRPVRGHPRLQGRWVSVCCLESQWELWPC